MTRLSTTLSVLGLAAMVAARKCQELTIGLDVSATNQVFNLATPKTDIDVTNILLELTKQGGSFVSDITTGRILLVTSAETGSYWDFPANNHNYSYTKTAVDDYGYATLAFDRLGVGASSHGDPMSEIQQTLELAALKALTERLRASTVPGLEYKRFKKIVHVGHSFGAIQTYGLTVNDSGCSLSDGIVLTGFTQNATFLPYFVLGGGFVQANSLPSLSHYAPGYVAPASVSGGQVNFFAPGAFDPEILRAAYQGGQPAALGELLTIGGSTGLPSSFTGPALVITGDRDIPFCGGNCSATGDPALKSILDTSARFLQAASPFESYVVAGAGHGLALEYSHVETTGKILDFFVKNGLAAR
ncbi:ctr copper transporter family protein [Colletotrichum higginsianum]|nr:ctr copper transporter family protein [Colletotrichum higginsianum]